MLFKRKSENRKTTKPPRLYRMRRALLDWFLFGGQLVLVTVVLIGGYYFLVNSDTFKLKEVELTGAFRHTTHQGVEKLAEIPFGRNLFAVSLNRVEENIRRHPWIKRVEVRRQLPAKIRIHVEEYEPVAIFRAGGDYLMSREGKIFKKLFPGEVSALPVVTGFDPDRLRRFPSYYRGHIEEAFSFLSLVLALPAAKHSEAVPGGESPEGAAETLGVGEVHYNATEGITVTTTKDRTEIYFGREDYGEKLDRWREFAAVKRGGDAAYRRIDLHVEGKIFARR